MRNIPLLSPSPSGRPKALATRAPNAEQASKNTFSRYQIWRIASSYGVGGSLWKNGVRPSWCRRFRIFTRSLSSMAKAKSVMIASTLPG